MLREAKEHLQAEQLKADGKACQDCESEAYNWICKEHGERLCWDCAQKHIDKFDDEVETVVEYAEHTVLEKYFEQVE